MQKVSSLFSISILLCAAFAAHGEVYKTTNPDGSVSYTDSPTTNSSKVIVSPNNVGSSGKSTTAKTPATTAPGQAELNQPSANDVKPVPSTQPSKTSGNTSAKSKATTGTGATAAGGGGSSKGAGGSATSAGSTAKAATTTTAPKSTTTVAPKAAGTTTGNTTAGSTTTGNTTTGNTTTGNTTTGNTTTGNTTTGNTTTGNTTTGNTTTGNTTTGNTSLLPVLPVLNAGVSLLRVNQLIDIILKDMNTEGEGIPETGPQKFAWAFRPTLAMGLNPTASGVPSWYPGTKFELWDQVLGWMTAYREKGAPYPANSRIAVKDLYLYYFSKSKKSWVLLEQLPAIKEWSRGEGNTEDTNSRTWFRMREEPDGSTSFIVPPGSWFHTYGHLQRFNAADYGGLYFRFDFKLVTDDPSKPNSLNKDRWVVQSGADYYPAAYPAVNLGAPYNPGVGTGRFLRAGPNWRTSTFLILSPEFDLKKYPPNVVGVYE